MGNLLFVVGLFLILMVNAGFVADGLHRFPSPRSSRAFIVHAILIFLIFTMFNNWTFIPKSVMYAYQLGNINHALLILDEVGCDIMHNYGLQGEKPSPNQKTCVLPDVVIHSRLGTPYYIEAHPSDTSLKRFTIPAQHVLSWSITNSKEPITAGSPQSPSNPTQ